MILQTASSTFSELNTGDYFDIYRGCVFEKDGNALLVNELDENIQNIISVMFKNSKKLSKFSGYVVSILEGVLTFEVVRFVHLHIHSGYSLLDGLSSIDEISSKVVHSCALTDHGNMFGMLKFYKSMMSKGKKPIIGFEAYAEDIKGVLSSNHLLLIAKNKKGVDNLKKLTSLSFQTFYKKPHVTYQNLRKYSEGIIVSSACMGGEIPRLIMNGELEQAEDVIKTFKEIFKDDFYLEIQKHSLDGEVQLNEALAKLGRKHDVKLIATADSHYTEKEDSEIHEVVLCLQGKKTLADETRFKFGGTGYHIHTEDEMIELFEDYPDAIENTLEIVKKVNFKFEFGEIYMPHFEYPSDFTSESAYFEHLCWKGFNERFKDMPELESAVYKERLKYEIETIINMEFPGYFLIVWDFIRYAKENGIAVGPGRGSVVGSLVAYALKITNLDPIPFGLLFERFLNPERVSMPDIDLDFDDERRDEVIQYVRKKYGDLAVSKIIAFGTMGARVAVRDTGRVLGYEYSVIDKIAKAIPKVVGMTLAKALLESPTLKELYDNDADVKKVIDVARKLEGKPRHTTIHACGLVIAPSDVSDYLPEILVEDKDTKTKERTTQVDKDETEELGLLKMDFLGLRTMGVISNAIKLANIKRAKQGLEPLDYEKMPPYDINVYKFISKGDLYGVFQLESPGMTSFMLKLFSDANDRIDAVLKIKDESKRNEAKHLLGVEFFERLIAGISLYRPGPMDEIPNYLENMKNPKSIHYDTPLLEPILKTTYGVIVYQEQVMEIVRELAGYSLGRSDLVRRGMAKKKEKIIAEESKNFVYGKKGVNGEKDVPGCIANGISEEVGLSTFDRMVSFAKYAFNKSHAGGYAVIAYQTAYLKHYYPIEFMTATLNSVIKKADKLKIYLSAVTKMNIKLLPPTVNESGYYFEPEGEAIRFGLKGLKNLGDISETIVEERNSERGHFTDYQDFSERMAIYHKVDKKMLEALVYSGALDSFKGNRHSKLSILEIILKNASSEKKSKLNGQFNIFDLVPELEDFKKIEIPNLVEFHQRHLLDKEKEYSGLYITGHPLDDFSHVFSSEKCEDIGLYSVQEDDEAVIVDGEESNSSTFVNGQRTKFGGIVKEFSNITTQGGKIMKKFILEDKTGEINCIMFPKQVQKYGHFIENGEIMIFEGELNDNDFGLQLIVNSVADPKVVKQNGVASEVWVRIDSNEQMNKLKEIVDSNPGKLPVFMKVNSKPVKYAKPINLNLSVFNQLREVFGKYVFVKYK